MEDIKNPNRYLARPIAQKAEMELMQIAQRATTLDRAIEFYRDVLGCELLAHFDPPGLVFFDAGQVRLLLEAAAPSALLYLRVDDVRTAIEELRGRGVEIISEPHEIFFDTEGTFRRTR